MAPVQVQTGPPPRSVRAAGWLWLAASLLYVAGWIAAAFIDHPFIAADFVDDPEIASGGEGEARAIAGTMVAFAALGAVVVGAAYTVLGFLLWRRQQWARVLLAVLGGVMLVVLPLDVLIGLLWRAAVSDSDFPAGDPRTDPWRGYAVLPVLVTVQFALTIAAIVAMFTPSANRFFAGARQRA